MRVIPVIDLMDGQVVRGVAGRRSDYRPIQSTIAVDARPATVAREFAERFGFETVYVADLDAIQGGSRNMEAYEAIKDAGLKLWLDAGASGPKEFSDVAELLLSRSIEGAIVIALECLQDPYDDRWWDNTPGANFPAFFSLDLKDGVPLHHVAEWKGMSAAEIGHAVYDLCFRDIIILDLADVGMSQGSRTLKLCRQLVDELDQVRIIAGGGVRGVADLEALASAGCYAALVASAIHDRRLTRDEVQRVEKLQR
jgi:phosphoribosylformimino-5-aminoimidazole carboxamide ribotide isomerase